MSIRNNPPRFAATPEPGPRTTRPPSSEAEASGVMTVTLAAGIGWHLRQRGAPATPEDIAAELHIKDREHLDRALRLALNDRRIIRTADGAFAPAEAAPLTIGARP